MSVECRFAVYIKQAKTVFTAPIFPELKTELEALFFDPASEGKEFVINRYRSPKQNKPQTLGFTAYCDFL